MPDNITKQARDYSQNNAYNQSIIKLY